MSDLLDSRLTPEQLQECEKNDALMGIKTAHGITRTGPAKVSGQHPSEAPNEPAFSEEELLAGDLERMQRRDQRFRQTLALVHEAELAYFRRMGML